MNHMVFLSQHLKWMCKQASTNTHTASLPQTLYNSALGSHRRQCRWNTPPSPAPSARCRRSENGTGRFVKTRCSFCLTTLRIKKIHLGQVSSPGHTMPALLISSHREKTNIYNLSLTKRLEYIHNITNTWSFVFSPHHMTIRWCSMHTFSIRY